MPAHIQARRGVEPSNVFEGKHRRCLSAGVNLDKSKKSPRVNPSLVWWRRGELNPCPKIVSALRLHV
jgi:hypothetical protein